MTTHAGKILQLLYGSTPWSAGYSVLAQSNELSQPLTEELISLCENYDQQLYAAPETPYSVVIFSLHQNLIFMEIFGEWRDQVGRPSRIMRIAIIDADSRRRLADNPFLLRWILPIVKRCISKKRNHIHPVPELDLQNVDIAGLWWRETRHFFTILATMSNTQKRQLFFLQNDTKPFVTREIATQKDCSDLCRAIVFAVTKEQRTRLQCSSFALNQKQTTGLCFRYTPYCQNPITLEHEVDISRAWKIATLSYSLPEPVNYKILAKIWQRDNRLYFALSTILFTVTLGLCIYLLMM